MTFTWSEPPPAVQPHCAICPISDAAVRCPYDCATVAFCQEHPPGLRKIAVSKATIMGWAAAIRPRRKP